MESTKADGEENKHPVVEDAEYFYVLGKEHEKKGDMYVAIECYKQAERFGHDLKDHEHKDNIPPIDTPGPLNCSELSPSFTLILVDLQQDLIEKLRKHFSGLPNVEFQHGRFEDLPEFDCMVSAANSFGLMDGGVDAAITRFFGIHLQERVQQHILEHYQGEQPVGSSFICSTHNPEHPYLAHTPTMRVPTSIRGTDYVYLAMKAMLSAVKRHNDKMRKQQTLNLSIKRVACTGLGTFYGTMDFDESARQMALAYRNFLAPPPAIHWGFASTRQAEVGYGGWVGFERELRSMRSGQTHTT